MPEDTSYDRFGVRSRGGSSWRWLIPCLLLALLVGGAGTLWAGQRLGWLDLHHPQPAAQQPALGVSPPAPQAIVAPDVDPAQTALGVRMAELEQRMTQLNLQADAASGNAARAESLLIAAAARRNIERGEPLGYLAGELKTRFGNAQPNAVQTLLEVSGQPVTLEALSQGLDALAPSLAAAPRKENLLSRVGSELSHLFVVRKADAPSPAPERRLERARAFLVGGRVEAAIGEVQRMPGQAAARDWVALAQRYARAQRALDLIETAAILEPRALNDAQGANVTAPSPASPTGADAI